MEKTLYKETNTNIQDGIDINAAAENWVYFSMATMIAINMAANKFHDLSHRRVNT